MTLPLTDSQLLRLEQLLGDPALDQAMALDEVQGYLCAALSGPQAMPEAQWLSEVLGGVDAGGDGPAREAADLLRLFAAELEAELASGEAPVLLLYPKEGDEGGPSDYVSWCQAYLHGIDTAVDGWFEFLGAEEGKEDSEDICFLDEQLFTLFMLTGDAEAAAGAAGDDWLSGEELERLQDECEARLPQVVADIHRFWAARRAVKTIRRETAKVGRNEPCACGSGKKFKNCCGAA